MNWYLNRKVNYYPFDIYLVNLGYTKYQQKNFGWGFKNTFFYYEDGVEYSYRGWTDMKDLKKYLQKKFNKKLVQQYSQKIKTNTDKLLAITKIAFKNKSFLQNNFDKFCEIYKNVFSVFQLPELCQILLSNADGKLLKQFGMARDYAARKLIIVEKIYRKKLGLLLGLTSEQGLMLLPQEVERVLQGKLSAFALKNRKESAILTLNNKIAIFWNKEAQVIFKREHKIDKTEVRELEGKIAFPGKVKGKVCVALNPNDFKNIPQNSILVCSMTRYDIVSHLKKVKAIITDQGGITCHAAIIARELKIPTLIGTQKATDILKTGDLVEVDAERGVVRRV